MIAACLLSRRTVHAEGGRAKRSPPSARQVGCGRACCNACKKPGRQAGRFFFIAVGPDEARLGARANWSRG